MHAAQQTLHDITLLYTQDSLPARAWGDVALRIGQNVLPFKRAVAASLTGAH